MFSCCFGRSSCRDRLGRLQGWESVCWCVMGIPLLEKSYVFAIFHFQVLVVFHSHPIWIFEFGTFHFIRAKSAIHEIPTNPKVYMPIFTSNNMVINCFHIGSYTFCSISVISSRVDSWSTFWQVHNRKKYCNPFGILD